MKHRPPPYEEAGQQAIPSQLDGAQPHQNRLAEVPLISRAPRHRVLPRFEAKFSCQAEVKASRGQEKPQAASGRAPVGRGDQQEPPGWKRVWRFSGASGGASPDGEA